MIQANGTCISLDSVLTDASGGYIFDTLIAGTYLIEIAPSNFAPGGPLANYASSTGVNGSPTGPYEMGPQTADVDAINNDDNGTALAIGGVWSDSIKLAGNEPISPIDSAGKKDLSGARDSMSNLTIDFGFYPLHSIGNLVWIDANNNGKLNAGEKGIDSVKVILHYFNGTTCVAIDSQYTDANGGYLFDSLVAGKYLVEIAAINFTTGKRLNKYASSSGSGAVDPNTGPYEKAPDPDGNIDNDDNGTMNGNLMFPGAVFSDTLDLNGNEPVSPNDTTGKKDLSGAADIMSNLTVDFGFFPLHSLGNQLFVDANNDGKMQPTESPLPGVKMILHYVDTTGGGSVCVTVDSILTDVNGKYVFDSLIAGKYIVEVAKSNFAPGGVLAAYASSTGGGSNTKTGPYEVPGMPIDGDTPADSTDHGVAGTGTFLGSVIGDTVDIGSNEPLGEPNDTTARDSLSNLTMDFGFFPLHSLGNYVWADANNNGVVDPGETAIPNVKVILHYVQANGTCISLDSVLTDASGGYIFDTLIAGTYLIEIAPSNFAPGGPLAGYASSTGVNGSATGPYEMGPQTADVDAINNDDNGTALAIGGVWSDSIKLAGNEPISPIDSAGKKDLSGARDSMSNLTIDFGFYPLHSIGDQVWIDANNNGKIDAGEKGVAGVTVVLHMYDPTTMTCVVVSTLITDAQGYYLFDSLVAGAYLIEIPASNLGIGGPLEGLVSSTGSGATDLSTGPKEMANYAGNHADSDTNLDDNGVKNGNAMFAAGSISSDTIHLGGSPNEPITESATGTLDTLIDRSGAADNKSNLTIDFGFVPLHTLGDQLFVDANNDGLYVPSDGDKPLSGVSVVLHYVDTTGGLSTCVTIDTVITGADGVYLFDSLIAGRYVIEIPKSNFAPGAPLANFASSTGTGVGGNTSSGPYENSAYSANASGNGVNFSQDDNGVKAPISSAFAGGVISDTIDLNENEPTNESGIANNPIDTTVDRSGALDPNSNMSIDFGFIQLFSLGNQVFADRNNDGLFGAGDIPIPGVVMELHALRPNDGGFTCVIVGYDTTDANGLYLFDSLVAGQYIVAISNSNFLLGGVLEGAYKGSTGSGVPLVTVPGPYENVDPNLNPNWSLDTIDNNDNGNLMPGVPLLGSVSGLIASDTFALGVKPSEPLAENPYNDNTVTDDHNNLTIDFGLVPLHTIGNQVWADANNNGLFDPTELPIAGVEVALHYVIPGTGACLAVDTVLTDSKGKYLFGYLIEGKYIIEITAKNFLPGGALSGYTSSTAGPDLTGGPYETLNGLTDGDRDVDNVDHGIKNLSPTFPLGSVASDTVTIISDSEPQNEIDPKTGLSDHPYDTTGASNINSNLTIDFGFVQLHSIGNQVFLDLDNNGIYNSAIDLKPFGLVKVVLHYVDTTGGGSTCIVLDTTYTDANGIYLFDSLRAGKYLVEITADNFNIGGPLEGMLSSTGNPADVLNGPYETGATPSGNTNIDGDDNGVKNRYPGFPAGSVLSDTVGIDDNVEPVAAAENTVPNNDFSGAKDNNSNLTIDFGFLVPCSDPVCIGHVNFSMDQNCQVCVSAKDVLKGKYILPDFFYTIEVFTSSGQKLPSNCIGREWLGYTLTYKITTKYPCNINSCWGTLKTEDKSPPQVGPLSDTLTCFEFAKLTPGSFKVKDNCSDSAIVNIVSETYTDYGCDGARYQGLVTRQLLATDIWGNTANLTKQIYIRKVTLDSLVCPRDTSVDCSLNYITIDKKSVSIADPLRSGVPSVWINGVLKPLWPNSPSCKISVSYTNDTVSLCGSSYKIFKTWRISDWCTGKDSICKQLIEVIDKTPPVVEVNVGDKSIIDTFLYIGYSSPHDCYGKVSLNTLRVIDCNKVTQEYSIKYTDETGKKHIVNGTLPDVVSLPEGFYVGEITLLDACNNRSSYPFNIWMLDITPPTPVCDDYTRVTLAPDSCWAQIKAIDLDNGSRDNCCTQLHHAVALMEELTARRAEVNGALDATCGKVKTSGEEMMRNFFVEELMNMYVFKETLDLGDCGTKQVVKRVYDVCKSRLYDPHVINYSRQEWYMSELYGIFRKDLPATYDEALSILKSKTAANCSVYLYTWMEAYMQKISKATNTPVTLDFTGTTQFDLDRSVIRIQELSPASGLFYQFNTTLYLGRGILNAQSTSVINISSPSEISDKLTKILSSFYNDCMVNVLVDDKQAPTVSNLEDITIYCDGAPNGSGYPICQGGDHYSSGTWPGTLNYTTGQSYGYYGGSAKYDTHIGAGDHNDPQACDQPDGWSPIYCKSWLYLDTFDQAGHVNPSLYFDVPVLVDKKHPLDHTLKDNEFIFKDNCILIPESLTYADNGTLTGCSEGWIQRTWTIKDKCGNPVTASQKIIVKHRSDFEVIFPADKKVTCDPAANGSNKTDTSVAGGGKPIISDDECEQVGLTYKDEVYSIEDSACYKIIRTWTLIDWCIYNPNQSRRNSDVIVDDRLRANETDRSCVFRHLKDNNDGYMQYVQVIKVVDLVAPDVTCKDQTICINDGCSATVNIPLQGTDNCSDKVIFRVDITKPDGTHDRRQDITSITGGFTAGLYSVQIIGKDRCGNEDTCNMKLTINDCKKPTPYCLNGIATVVMPSSGTIEVWAKDLDKGSSDNCTAPEKLKFSFKKNSSEASQIFTCKSIPNGKEQAIPVEIWVTDESGNQDACTTYILLQDNGGQSGGVCKDTTLSVANVTGRLLTEDKEGVEFAQVEIKGQAGIPGFKTTTNGSYTFSSIPMNGGASIKALRDDNPMNGVSTLDLVLIQKHILGTEKLNSPYKMIAADINNSNDITAIDLIELRKLILGIYDKLPTNTSWKFVPKSYAFPDLQTPWGYPTEDVLHEMSENMVRDFVGVKIGDVNSSAIPHSLMGTEIRGNETGLILEVKDQVFRAGEKVEVTFRSPNFKGITGMQGTMKIEDRSLKLEGIEQSGILKVGEQNFGRRWENEGLITMSWNTSTSMDVKDDAVLFTMNFIAQTAGRLSEVLRIGSQHTLAESYEGKGELGNLSIRFINAEGHEVTGKSELYQNYPNPFDHRTVIGVNLSDTGRGTLKITDVTGRTIKVIEQDWTKGYHEVWLDRREIQASGVLYYSFESKTFRAVKKMVIIE